jgi:hypothetical protein
MEHFIHQWVLIDCVQRGKSVAVVSPALKIASDKIEKYMYLNERSEPHIPTATMYGTMYL